MNEVMRRRIIGLSVILAALFLLSLLLPQHHGGADGDGGVTEVRVGEAAHYDPNAVPAPPAQSRPDGALDDDAAAAQGFHPEPAEVPGAPPPPPPPEARPTVAVADAASEVAESKAAESKASDAPPAASAPTPKAAPPPLAKPAPKPVAKAEPKPPAKPEPKPPESKPPAPKSTPAAAGGHWYVQVGSYSAEGNAKTVVKLLNNAGYPADSSLISTSKGPLYRVRVGPYADADAADAALAKIRKQGYPHALRRSD